MNEPIRTPAAEPRPDLARSLESDEAERRLGRVVAAGLPLVCLAAAITAGVTASVGSALLVVAAGALVGAIALLWASLRTLSGDAPLPEDLATLTAARRHGVDALAERKRRALRALKDLEAEHALGKIDDADYAAVVARYRDEAKAVIREMDVQIAPWREEAERVAREYLERHTVSTGAPTAGDEPRSGGSPGSQATARGLDCSSCLASNEADALFCKRCGARLERAVGALEKLNET